MSKSFPVLFKSGAGGRTIEWETWVEPDGDKAVIFTKFGFADGKKRTLVDVVRKGKNSGKSNATTPWEQACLEAEAEWKCHLSRKGYGLTPDASAAVRAVSPMLAQDIVKYRGDIDWANAFAQPKLDGYRCLALLTKDGVQLYSREHQPVLTMPHIVEDLKEAARAVFDNTIFDGELYCHGMPFQQIASAVKKLGDLSKDIRYHVYDMVASTPYAVRLECIRAVVGNSSGTLQAVETVIVGDRDDLHVCQQRFVENGYEGAMLRHGKAGYEAGKRSKHLLKAKFMQDDEFRVVDVKEGRGTCVAMAIFVCVTEDGHFFEVLAPGTHEDKRQAWKNASSLIGKRLTVKFQAYTTGDEPVPRFPVAKAFKD